MTKVHDTTWTAPYDRQPDSPDIAAILRYVIIVEWRHQSDIAWPVTHEEQTMRLLMMRIHAFSSGFD